MSWFTLGRTYSDPYIIQNPFCTTQKKTGKEKDLPKIVLRKINPSNNIATRQRQNACSNLDKDWKTQPSCNIILKRLVSNKRTDQLKKMSLELRTICAFTRSSVEKYWQKEPRYFSNNVHAMVFLRFHSTAYELNQVIFKVKQFH